MNKKKSIVLAAITAMSFSVPALAGGSVTFGYMPSSEIEISAGGDSGSVDGDGFSLQGAVDINHQLFVYGEHYNRTFDEGGESLGLNSTRVGLGVVLAANDAAVFWAGANLERWTTEFDGDDETDSGYGIRGGVNMPLGPTVYATAEIAYVDIADSSGFELAAGLGVPIAENVSLIVDYRLLSVTNEDDFFGDIDLDVTDIRGAVRFDF